MKHFLTPDLKTLQEIAIDITSPTYGVEVIVDKNNSIIWVNVDGICVFRTCRTPLLISEIIEKFQEVKTQS